MPTARRSSLVLALVTLACRPQPAQPVTTSPDAPTPSDVTPTPIAASAPTEPASPPMQFVIDDALASSRGPVAMGKLIAGRIEVDDALRVEGSEPPITVRVLAVEEFRKPGVSDPAAGTDVGLLLALPDGVGLDALPRGAVLVPATVADR